MLEYQPNAHKNCPYCNAPMKQGTLSGGIVYVLSSLTWEFGVYWLPSPKFGHYFTVPSFSSQKQAILTRGGRILGEVNRNFHKTKDVITWLCPDCDILLTELNAPDFEQTIE